jgi:hypothetical protein
MVDWVLERTILAKTLPRKLQFQAPPANSAREPFAMVDRDHPD